ncbi:MAG TPA: hypothetical protein VGS00_00910 [Thermoanaerobaculia bacterium]|nr:hypothetical protein [Thermoanaerobaculia bacterium]
MSSALPVTPGSQPMTQGLPPEKGGCMRAGLVGCGVVALLVVLIFVGGVLYVRKNPGVLLDFAMRGIERNYGPDVTEEDKKELQAAVEEFKEGIRSKRIRNDSSMGFQRSLTMRNSSSKLSHEDIQGLIRMFRDAVGKPGRLAGEPPPAATLVPMTAPTPFP